MQRFPLPQPVVAFLVFGILWLLLASTNGIWSGGFQFTDDVILCEYHSRLQQDGFFTVWKQVTQQDLYIRCRPIALTYYLFTAFLFQTNFTAITAWNLLIATWACTLFWCALRKMNFSVIESFLFVLILYGGNQGTIAIRTVMSENPALLLLACSLLLMAYQKKTIAVIFFILSALTKESFLLLLPALLWADYLQNNAASFRSYIKENIQTAVLLSISGMAVLAVILFKSGTHSIQYAGIDEETFNLHHLCITGFRLFITKGYLIPVLVALWLMYRKQQDILLSKNSLLFAVLLLLIAVPQWILFSKSLIFMHYLMPGMLWSALAVTVCYRYMMAGAFSLTEKWLFRSMIVGGLGMNIFLLNRNVRSIALSGSENREILETIRNYTSQKARILLVGDPVWEEEKMATVSCLLTGSLYQRSNITTLAVSEYTQKMQEEGAEKKSSTQPDLLLFFYHYNESPAWLSDKARFTIVKQTAHYCVGVRK